ncbi:MAG: hypothetical protein KDM91_22685 [Verrucomicrobiae bacterium]|nr:hypothetical protein [Verrucomicrobiae bacterium]MCP5540395.1 hypothetical protein [Akkermansiaceae bacterium]
MKPNPEDLESLWKQLNADHTDDAVDEAAAASVQPALDDVIRQLRGQRGERRRRRQGLATLVIAGLVVGLVIHQRKPAPPAVVESTSPPPPLSSPVTRESVATIPTVNDAQLLSLLKDRPIALLTLADGSKEVMILAR